MSIWSSILSGLGSLFGGGQTSSTGGGGGSESIYSDIIKTVGPAVISGLTQSHINSNNEDTIRQLEELARQREDENYQIELQNWRDQQAAAEANDAARLDALSAAMALQKEYYEKAMQYYLPYLEAGKEVLPTHIKAYNEGMSALSQALGRTQQDLGNMPVGASPGVFKF